MIYCSGNIGIDPAATKLVDGSITNRTIQALTNLKHVLEAGGSKLENVVKVNVFITTMKDFDAMNAGYLKFFSAPLPVCACLSHVQPNNMFEGVADHHQARTCVAVKELPLGTDVEIECIAHL